MRSDGLGDWSRAIEDVLTGPASQNLLADGRSIQAELAKQLHAGAWQYDSVLKLKKVLDLLDISSEDVPVKSDMKRWFRLFATLRNKTRAHGAVTPAQASMAAIELRQSIDLFAENFSIFSRPWAFLYRNLSGKYRVSQISNGREQFDYLTKESHHTLEDGVYIFLSRPLKVPLVESTSDVNDFFFANGGFDGERYEVVSYASGDRDICNASQYRIPPGQLPARETQGFHELEARGNVFTNAPEPIRDYVIRDDLEATLYELLLDDRRPVLTLWGRGGIGKTSLALCVIDRLCAEDVFDLIVWFSARDIDLTANGPKPVRREVIGTLDISRQYSTLVLSPEESKNKSHKPQAFFERQLSDSTDYGKTLFVFDNFETTSNPTELYEWIDTFVRLPNKVLITTRLRDFKGDYPTEVRGMTDGQAEQLVEITATSLGIREKLSGDDVARLINEASGHPYVLKVLLGTVADTGAVGSVPQMVAGSDEMLTALLERTYASLNPCAIRAFLTLAAWNSAVPRVALEAVLVKATGERDQVEQGIESLIQYSMAELSQGDRDNEFMSLPLVSRIFGLKKLNVSPNKSSIERDSEILQLFGATRPNDLHLGLAKRLDVFIKNVARHVDQGRDFEHYREVVEMLCRTYPPAWIAVARWQLEFESEEGFRAAVQYLNRYLELYPDNEEAVEAWRLVAYASFRIGDRISEINAFVRRSQLSEVSFQKGSNTANLFNKLLASHEMNIELMTKQDYARQLLTVLVGREEEATADDYSRMAWLAIHSGEEQRAIDFIKRGLAEDPANDHCARLAKRFNI